MDAKKISFGFTKAKKPTPVVAKPTKKDDVEYIVSIEDKKLHLANGKSDNTKKELIIPLRTDEQYDKESTIDDYNEIPVGDFGLAMLRGMGWTPGKGIGKSARVAEVIAPVLRPKGMGLGADKFVKDKMEDEKNNDERLKLIKGSFVRFKLGTNKGKYGQVDGQCDETGRIFVKTADGTVSTSELAVRVVSKEDYKKNYNVVNKDKYEDYKRRHKN